MSSINRQQDTQPHMQPDVQQEEKLLQLTEAKRSTRRGGAQSENQELLLRTCRKENKQHQRCRKRVRSRCNKTAMPQKGREVEEG